MCSSQCHKTLASPKAFWQPEQELPDRTGLADTLELQVRWYAGIQLTCFHHKYSTSCLAFFEFSAPHDMMGASSLDHASLPDLMPSPACAEMIGSAKQFRHEQGQTQALVSIPQMKALQ